MLPGIDVSIRRAKDELRRQALVRRRAAAAAEPQAAPRLMANLLASVPIPASATVSGFWPMGDEIDVRPILAHLHERGHVCGLPVTGPRGTALRFRRWTPETVMVPAVFGTREPPPDTPLVEPDLLLVPLLAFDATGMRLGYGAGYYDRTIAELAARRPILTVGVAYAAQEVPAVPHDAGDRRLDWIVTEQGARQVPAPHPSP